MTQDMNLKRLQNAIASLEVTRYLLYHQLAAMHPDEFEIDYLEALPKCVITENTEPVHILQFSFEGRLPIYFEIGDRHNKDHLKEKYRAQNKDYYISAMHQAINRQQIQTRFNEKVVVAIVHLFADMVVRDLDNRNRKYLIDGIKACRIIADDNWHTMSLTEDGFLDKEGKERVEVFIAPYKGRFFLSEKIEHMYSY